MISIRLSVTSIASENFNSSIAAAFGALPVGELILIPETFGKGSLYRKEVEKGLILGSWDFALNRDIIINKQPVAKGKNGKHFSIVYVLNARNIYMENAALKKSYSLKHGRGILFKSDDADIKLEVPAGEPYKAMTITVSEDWLKREFNGGNESFGEYINGLCNSEEPTMILESSTQSELLLLGDLNKQITGKVDNVLYMRAKVLSLVSDFFSRIVNREQPVLPETRLLHYAKMKEVEFFLKEHLEKKLPDIQVIARHMALSVSTLKRHFKIVFDKNIYAFYLELKMEHAKHLLIDRHLSVNEVANLLDYEKVSCFIDMFKKHYGICPGETRRKSA
jgi:AraC-like DNA-binding protein